MRDSALGSPGIAPLSARSVLLSLLLGSHPDRMTSFEVTRAGEHFGIPATTMRVALTRAVAAGDLQRVDGDYVLGDRLVARQRRQDEAVNDAATPWNGTWEMAVVVVAGRPGPERAALREALANARLAELREGVWARPANLRRAASYADNPVLACFTSRPDGDPVSLASNLWNLVSWVDIGHQLLNSLKHTREPAARLAVAAHVVRHLTADPLLPGELLPEKWPGAELRAAYADYQSELRGLRLL